MDTVLKIGLAFVLVSALPVFAGTYGRLVNVAIDDPLRYEVRLRDVEGLGGWIYQGNSKKTDVENTWFTLNQSSNSMSLIIPWAKWNDHDIAIQVWDLHPPDQVSSKLVGQVRLQDTDENGTPSIMMQWVIDDKAKEYFSKKGLYCDPYKCVGSPCKCDTSPENYHEVDVDITIRVDNQGAISMRGTYHQWNGLDLGTNNCRDCSKGY